MMYRNTGAPLLQHKISLVFLSLGFLFLTDVVFTSTTESSASNKGGDDDDDEGIPKSMIIGLSVGFGSVCVILICCCCAFKCIGCKDGRRKNSSSSRRKVAWDS